ncbi:MAG: 4-alpha-glucanotransferase [Acidobacteriota bacterium]
MSGPLAEKLARLGVRRLLLAIFDASFPSDPDEDLGRGSPATRAAERLFAYARALGFTGIQLGPQGQTARGNPSPYDGTIFSRNVGNIPARTLRELAGDAAVDAALVAGGGPVHYLHAYDASHALVARAYDHITPELGARLGEFRRANASWLEPDALHAALCATHGGTGFRDWPERERELWLRGDRALANELLAAHADAVARYAFGQLLVHEAHARARDRAQLALYGDLQVGYSDADAWTCAPAFLRGWDMGAPPSRTNPDGQPWGYPVLDPAQYTGTARALVDARADKAFREYDSLRIDHPHGLVCPWVYRPERGVAAGTRLFESPDDPELARFAIARADQLDRGKPRYADDWVHGLDAAQVDRYSILFDALLAAAVRHGRARADLSCEVLSTLPAPLGRVLARYGLGRWRVTQKANLDDASDVYRSENFAREDWAMLGNHDTAPILAVVRGWPPAKREQWARHLAARLHLAEPARLARDGFLATAMLAEIFASRAENVSIFFADLFGFTERFNSPGVIDDANWTLRLPHDFERLHADRLAREEALDVPLAVDLALEATG